MKNRLRADANQTLQNQPARGARVDRVAADDWRCRGNFALGRKAQCRERHELFVEAMVHPAGAGEKAAPLAGYRGRYFGPAD